MEWRHTVWPEAQLIYTAVAKVANTSVKSALLESFAPEESRANPHAVDVGYITVRPELVGRRYPGFCHVAVARNPFDRLVSFWADKIDGDGMNDGLERLGFRRKMQFAEAVAVACALPDSGADPHIRSQSWLLLNHAGRMQIDLLLRFERLACDWRMLARLVRVKAGVDLRPLPRRRTSEHATFASYYDDATQAMVVARYATDFRVLGYPATLDPGFTAAGHLPDGDPIAAAVRSAPGGGVLDLTVASAARAAEVEARGGFYVATARRSAVGHLSRFTALETGRIAEMAFDALLVDGRDLAGRQPHTWLAERFRATGRAVVIV